MELAIEKLRKYRDEGYRSHNEIIELWTNILSKCDLSTLGDEKWLILEQVFKSALHCSKESIAHQCLEQLEKQFRKTSPLLITLNAMYFESIGDFEKAEQISSTLIDENETNDVKKFLDLINYLLHICKRSCDLPSTCLNLIEDYCRKITESKSMNTKFIHPCAYSTWEDISDDNSLLNDMKKVLNEIKNLLQLIDLNDKQTEKINLILGDLDFCYSRLSNDIHQMKKELLNVKDENKHIQKNQDDQNVELKELRKEITELKKQSSRQILREVFAHLLNPFIEQITKEFQEINKEQTSLAAEPYDLIKYYNRFNLREMKSDAEIDQKPLAVINNVINNFVQESKISKSDFIDLLIDKTNRNYKSHHLIDLYITDFINNQHTENFIDFLEYENSTKLFVDTNDIENLNKLLNLNIKLRKKQNSLNAFLDQFFYTLQEHNDMINGPFRMPIVEQYKEMGTIVMGEIESGSCRVGDQCVIMPNGTRVEIINIYHEDRETDSCVYGQNVRLELKNVEEEKISPGFILCNAQQKPCRAGRIFESEVTIIKCQSKIYPGYSAVLHIHAAVVEVYLKELIKLIDRKTGETTRKKPRFIKQDQVAIARFELSQSGQVICMEPFERFPRLGRFALLHKDRRFAVGKVLKIIR